MAGKIKYSHKKRTYTGTSGDDVLNAKSLDYVVPQTGKNRNKGLTIKGGKGNDTITGTTGNDKISGGTGINTVNYSKDDGNDIIYLTKGENFTLNLTNTTFDDLKFEFANKNKDLRIYTSKTIDGEYITLKNFVKKNVAGVNGNVKLSVDGKTYDLKTSRNLTDNEDVVLYKTKLENGAKNFTGSWLNDEIDASEVTLYKKVKKGKKKITVEKYITTETGLTLKGGAGNDKITGTKYSDKIYGNTGNDVINAGTGNNCIYFNIGDGNDIIENGNGFDTLIFPKKTNLSYDYNKYDLIIKYSDNDSVTLKDYFIKHSVQYIQIGNNKQLFNPPAPKTETHEEDGYTIFQGTDINDKITGTDGNDKIYSNGGKDIINSKSGNDIIYCGDEMQILEFETNSGDDIIHLGNGIQVLELVYDNSDGNTDIFYTKDHTDLIITKTKTHNNPEIPDITDTITIKDYFLSSPDKTSIMFNDSDVINLSEYISDKLNETCELTDNGQNTDIISNGGTDTFIFPENTDLVYEHDFADNDLIIRYRNSSVTLKDYYLGNHSVTKIGENNISDLIANYTNEIYRFSNESDITELLSNGGDDSLIFTEDLSYTRNVGNYDLIVNYGENKLVTIKEYFKGNHSVKQINNTPIETLINNNINEIYDFSDGYETTEISPNGRIDTLIFPECILEYEPNQNNNDLIIHYGNKNVLIKDYYRETSNFKINNNGIDKTLGTTIINAESGLEINNDNTHIYTLKFNEHTKIKYSKNNNDLELRYGKNGLITLKDYFINNKHSVRQILNGDEQILLFSDTITEPDNNDNLYGTNNSEVIINNGLDLTNIYGLNGIDFIINNGSISDTIFGNEGNDFIQNTETATVKTIKGGVGDDTIINDGIISGNIYGDDGDDTINNNGMIMKNIYGGSGNDIIINNGIVHNIYGNNENYGYGYGNDNIITNNGTALYVICGNGNDVITNNGFVNYICGGGGNDTITTKNASKIYTHHNTFSYSKDTIQGTTAIVHLENTTGVSSVYAQTETNIIYGTNHSDKYYAYSNLTTIITDNGGDDELTLINSRGDTDGEKDNLNIIFNVSKDYKISDGINFGDIFILDNTNLQNRRNNKTYTGITIKNNAVETIYSGDNYKLTSTQIAELAQSVAGWLTSDGRNFFDVNDVLTNGTNTAKDNLFEFIAENTNWEQVQLT